MSSNAKDNEISIKLNKKFVFGTLFVAGVVGVSGLGYHYILNNLDAFQREPTPIVAHVAPVIATAAIPADTFVSGITPLAPVQSKAVVVEVAPVATPPMVAVAVAPAPIPAPPVVAVAPIPVAPVPAPASTPTPIQAQEAVAPDVKAAPRVAIVEETSVAVADLASLLSEDEVVVSSDEDNRPLPTTELGDYKFLADSYDKGIGVKASPERAFFWYRKAAQQGDLEAQHQTASFYLAGKGVEKDEEKGLFWYKKAAAKGYVAAQHNLGAYYDRKGDFKNALKYYKLSADRGLAVDQFNMAVFYLRGQGVKQDKEEGLRWLRKAAINGDKQALKILAGTG